MVKKTSSDVGGKIGNKISNSASSKAVNKPVESTVSKIGNNLDNKSAGKLNEALKGKQESKTTQKKTTEKTSNDDFYLHFKISHSNVEFELTTKDPKVLDKIQPFFSVMPDLDMQEFHELSLKLSEPFSKNKDVAKLLQEMLSKDDDYLISSVEIPTMTDIDIERQTKTVKINPVEIRKSIAKLVSSFDSKNIKYGIVHICGEIASEDKLIIVDNIHKNMPTAQLRAFQSTKSLSSQSVLVECIFFGEFDFDDD